MRIRVSLLDLAHNNLLVDTHGDGVHFNKFDPIRVVHSKSIRQFCCNVPEQRAIHAPVHFIQDQQVGLLKKADLFLNACALAFDRLGLVVFHQSVELLRISESESNGIEL